MPDVKVEFGDDGAGGFVYSSTLLAGFSYVAASLATVSQKFDITGQPLGDALADLRRAREEFEGDTLRTVKYQELDTTPQSKIETAYKESRAKTYKADVDLKAFEEFNPAPKKLELWGMVEKVDLVLMLMNKELTDLGITVKAENDRVLVEGQLYRIMFVNPFVTPAGSLGFFHTAVGCRLLDEKGLT